MSLVFTDTTGRGVAITSGVLRGEVRGEIRNAGGEPEGVWMDWQCDLFECPVLYASEEMLHSGDRCTRLRLANGEDVILNASFEVYQYEYGQYARGQTGWRRLFTGRR